MADATIHTECNDSKELLGQGIRAFILQDFEGAVAALSKTSELLVAEHNNDMHDSLADVYLYYGKALLGLSREQNEFLGDAVPKNSAEDSEDEDKDIETEESEKNNLEQNNVENAVNDESKNEETVKSKDQRVKLESENEQKTEEQKNSSDVLQTNALRASEENSQPGPSSKAADEETTEDQKEDEQEPTDLQVAWEVLELAKKIFQRKGEEAKKSLAEALIVLGEVSLESENFQSAINDIKEGLEIQKSLFGSDSRTVAETFYKLGIAYSTNSHIDEAIENFSSSLEYLQNRIKTLEKNEEITDAIKEEIEEIRNLIPDIEEKITDMKSYKEEAMKKITEAIKEPSKSTINSASSTKPAANISHLVKRKRKIDEVDDKDKDDIPAKKPPS